MGTRERDDDEVSAIERTDDALDRLRERTPARVFAGRAGGAYTTAMQLALRADHAAARDAVHATVDFDEGFLRANGIVEVNTRARSTAEYLRRPDLGRLLDEKAAERLRNCARGCDVQLVVGDGLSATAVHAQVPVMLPALVAACALRGWTCGTPVFVRHARVGVMNALGNLLAPDVMVLLVGERPGLASAEGLSAYLAWRPRAGHTDAERNVVANIHSRGVPADVAVGRVVAFVETLREARASGVTVKERFVAG